MPSCICLNNNSEESFHFLVEITLGGSHYLTFFHFSMHLRRIGISHSRGHRIDCTDEVRHAAIHTNYIHVPGAYSDIANLFNLPAK